ncbi:amino acid ABC transporter substrate-binding protein [Zeimonas arvi]|uniref:ABC transporter substrate-binding protein n=1 Tax=Zeimonas arvi TaxID=2498847 RepID=A0A5C8NQU9_9BURK|nr:amino acid ABC transporter substrate-binding protein [Zeimonas arvi]TXL64125.1 ABC transporter substrate-binding protein [Zeimonas arvi]
MPGTVTHQTRTTRSLAKLALSAAVAVAPALFAVQASAQGTIRFGAPLPLTGALAPEAVKQQQGYDLWAETVNAAGGIDVGGKKMKVEIVYTDYQSNTPRAVQAAEKLITQEKVDFLFSPFGSGAAKAASTVSERYGVPTIASTASSSQVYDQGYKYLFGTFTPNDTLTNPLSDIVVQKAPGVKRVAILARNDLFPLAIAQEMEKSAKQRGMNVVVFEKYAINTMDHSSALAQIKASSPHWIFATGYINDLVLLKKQMADQRIEAPVVTMIAGPAYQEFIDAAGPGAENISSASWWHPAARYKGSDIFGTTENYVKAFRARYKSDPDYAQASASVSGALFQMAIEKAGTLDKAKVRDELAAMNVMTFWGPVKFGPTGQITSLEPPVFQIQGGKTVVVHPQPIKQGDFKLGVK